MHFYVWGEPVTGVLEPIDLGIWVPVEVLWVNLLSIPEAKMTSQPSEATYIDEIITWLWKSRRLITGDEILQITWIKALGIWYVQSKTKTTNE